VVLVVLLLAAPSTASDCTRTSTGLDPLTSLGSGLYLGRFSGGLYPGGSNEMPAAHREEGLRRARSIEPLGADGLPDPDGEVVLLSVGMCNTSLEFCGASLPPCSPASFAGMAALDERVDHERLVLVNGATGGQPAEEWDSADDPVYDLVRDQRLAPQGLSESQVQVAWILQASARPTTSLPASDADALVLEERLGDVVRTLRERYPNLSMVYLSSRIYAGYATSELNPEPYAYESGFSVKWLIEAQIDQMGGGGVDERAGDLDYQGAAPWLAWGPYLWADGLIPRAGDGLVWQCSDFNNDGTHPGVEARRKVGGLLLDFLLDEPTAAPWFLAGGDGGDPPGGGEEECVPSASALCLADGAFRVTAEWRSANGGGTARAEPLREDTGAFWFFDPDNLELMVKVLDGCAENGHRWVFAGGSTDLEVSISVEEVESGLETSYRSPLGEPFRAVRDTQAFACAEGAPILERSLTFEVDPGGIVLRWADLALPIRIEAADR
jgi:hypothetical protein